jgi:hypothetical protein
MVSMSLFHIVVNVFVFFHGNSLEVVAFLHYFLLGLLNHALTLLVSSDNIVYNYTALSFDLFIHSFADLCIQNVRLFLNSDFQLTNSSLPSLLLIFTIIERSNETVVVGVFSKLRSKSVQNVLEQLFHF